MRRVLAIAALVWIASCSGTSASTTTDTISPIESVAATAGTTTPPPTAIASSVPAEGTSPPTPLPDHYRFGPDGLVLVTDVPVRLFDGEVWNAQRDGEGGVVFHHESPSGVAVGRVRAGSTDVEPVTIERPGHLAGFLVVEGRLTAVIEDEIGTEPCPGVAAFLVDVEDGRERLFTCGLPLEGGSMRLESAGGGLFVGTFDVSAGAGGTSVGLVFWDDDGGRVEPGANPFPAVLPGCAPCRLAGRLSPDGTTLAYVYRPDAKWPPAVWDDRSDAEWWESTRAIAADVVVIDLESGRELFRDASPAGAQLTDYDGRYIAVGLPADAPGGLPRSLVFDTQGPGAVVEVAGWVRFR